MSEHLFDPGPPRPEPPKESADRRRTLRNQASIDAGYHPVTSLPLMTNGHTCGDCTHRALRGGVAGRYWKCGARDGAYVTGGPASDIRLKWPACTLWEVDPDD